MLGNGDGILIITKKNKKILVDGGGEDQEEGYSIGENVLLPYLLDRGIMCLDYIVLSHLDSDHCLGALYVMENIKVKNLIISKQGEESENYNRLLNMVQKKNINLIEVKRGDRVYFDKSTYVDILWPNTNQIEENILNNNSIVMKLSYTNFKMLFTGDIEEEAEKEIVDLYKNTNILEANVLKVAHHGSKTSSSEIFLKLVNPKIALIGVR
ncbi:MAG: MBL fold metallo-hydrolase [Clostridia bacterium]|nr:MBL fold metallo-hydrolase [Clostridia bacterium]